MQHRPSFLDVDRAGRRGRRARSRLAILLRLGLATSVAASNVAVLSGSEKAPQGNHRPSSRAEPGAARPNAEDTRGFAAADLLAAAQTGEMLESPVKPLAKSEPLHARHDVVLEASPREADAFTCAARTGAPWLPGASRPPPRVFSLVL